VTARVVERLVVRPALIYGRWAARHEPYSFVTYPLLALVAPLLWWLVAGAIAALVVLVLSEGLAIGFCLYFFYVRRRRLRQ
jgi:hypothetical protein